MKERKKILIAIQPQSNKEVLLFDNGSLVCGRFIYKGRYKVRFKEIYRNIHDTLGIHATSIDVSSFKYWTAIEIYNEIILKEWSESISSAKIEELAKESLIYTLIEEIKSEFKIAVERKWKRIFKKSDINTPDCPRQAWQIL